MNVDKLNNETIFGKKDIKMKRRKLKIKNILILLVLIIVIMYFYIKNIGSEANNTPLVNTDIVGVSPKYSIIKQDYNDKYSGVGQKTIENQDGYFTTFTTVKKYEKTYKEYKQNGNNSWSNNEYWSGTMSDNGCGITALAIILSGYNKNYTPENLREKYYPFLSSEKISKELSNTFGIKNSDFYYDSVHLSKKSIEEHLKTNRPVLICVWNKPTENRFTTTSHYMVLLASDENGMVYLSNPNGLENDYKSSGWYNIDEITPYIAKALYIESY